MSEMTPNMYRYDEFDARFVAERTAQLRALAAELTQSEERERRRIAQILHDDLQQHLAFVDGVSRAASFEALPSWVRDIVLEGERQLDRWRGADSGLLDR